VSFDLRIRGGQTARRPADAKHAAKGRDRKGTPVRRLLTSLVALVLLLTVAAPAVLAAEPFADSGRAVISLDGPVDVPAGQHLDALVVANGDARIAGDVRHVLLMNGTATASGATIGSLLVMNGTAILQDGTTVTGDVSTLNGTISAAPGTTVVEPVRDLRGELAALSIALIPLFLIFMLGAALLVVVIALFLAAIAGRQVRSVESLISREPGPVLLAGIVGAFVLPFVSILLMATVIGAPLGLALLLVVLPVMAFLGWLVAAIWLGDWIVERLRGAREPQRPYLAAAVGVVVLAFAGMIPFVSMIATVFGFGAVLLATWRVLRGGSATTAAPGTIPPAPGGPAGYREPSSLPGGPGMPVPAGPGPWSPMPAADATTAMPAAPEPVAGWPAAVATAPVAATPDAPAAAPAMPVADVPATGPAWPATPSDPSPSAA
jgi:hypothetical protein